MKRDRQFIKKMVLAGMIATTMMAFCGCGGRERGEAISLEDFKQEIEVRSKSRNAGSDVFSVVINADVPEEVPEEDTLKDMQDGNVRDKMEQTEEVEPSPVTTKESGGESVPTQVLLDRNDIAQIKIVNGSNGERITLTEGNSGKVVLDGMVYTEDGSDVGGQLEQYIAENYTAIRPVCIEIPYPPENLD